MEYAVAHGYLMARVEGYAAKRIRGRSGRHAPARETSGPSGDWASQLATMVGRGRQPVGNGPAPADSPVRGMTTDSFRAEVAAMRQAEYERASSRKAGPH